MSVARRREIVLLCLVAVITALGMALTCAALHNSAVRATRGVVPVAILLLVSFLMDLTGKGRDRTLLPIVAMICGIGIIMLWRLEGPRSFQASKQIVWMTIGAGLMLATYLVVVDVRSLSRFKYIAGAGAVLLLMVTMIWGQERYGARLWIAVGNLSLQPGEFAKILMAISLAGYAADRGQIISQGGRDRWGLPLVEIKYLGPIGILVLFCLALFVTQRDLGAAVLFFGLAVAVIYLSTGRRTYVLLGLIAFAGGALLASNMFPHVHRRMVAWLYPQSDPSGAGLQTLRVMYGLGEGGVLGTGLGLGMPQKMPAVATDLIFGAVGEELGLAGTLALLTLFAMATFNGFMIAWRSRDRFGMLLAASLTTVFALQTLVIVGGVIRAFPLTGITLPFVSYGGTSVVVNFISIGLLLAVSRDCTGAPERPLRNHA
ncbi:FtsW/RodA/SpoVE family cell cycle protein [bacterium]|nr:FtsW/RodA/SpoVE family cell cycle protein [bacterium]